MRGLGLRIRGRAGRRRATRRGRSRRVRFKRSNMRKMEPMVLAVRLR